MAVTIADEYTVVIQNCKCASNQASRHVRTYSSTCMTDALGPKLDLWKHQLGYVPDAVWSRRDPEILALNALD